MLQFKKKEETTEKQEFKKKCEKEYIGKTRLYSLADSRISWV